MRTLMLMTGLAIALLAGAANAQQNTTPQPGDLNTVQTLGTMRATTGGAPGTGNKPDWLGNGGEVKDKSLAAPPHIFNDKPPETLSRTVGNTEDAKIMASPVSPGPAGSVAAMRPEDYKATGEPLRIAPYTKGVKMDNRAKDGRK
ncbi:hypothetical protein [Niveispirillum sp. KHB5.9]|uniref:hypothetical protein n=1 Tax=Niveispirillum sp. KHB5.9 TaxID=3400269 RepID=UPI003A87F8A9